MEQNNSKRHVPKKSHVDDVIASQEGKEEEQCSDFSNSFELGNSKDFARRKQLKFLSPSDFRYGKLGGQSVRRKLNSRWWDREYSVIECDLKYPLSQVSACLF